MFPQNFNIKNLFNISKIISGTNKTLTLVNNLFPIYYNVKPIVKNVKTLSKAVKLTKNATKKEKIHSIDTSNKNNKIDPKPNNTSSFTLFQ